MLLILLELFLAFVIVLVAAALYLFQAEDDVS